VTPFGRIARPSKEVKPSALRRRIFGLELAPVVRSIVAPSTLSGSISSYIAPSSPDSSPNTIVPHGVARTGSPESVPETIVVASPVSRSIFCRPGSPAPSSLIPMM
jgi:hypothetical protein